MKVVVFGANGWIGQYFIPILKNAGFDLVIPARDIRVDQEGMAKEILTREKPTHVVSLIGRTHGEGYSTIDYLEQEGKLVENVRDNLYSPVFLALLCKELGIHYTYLGTGCIFSEDDPTTKAFTEEDVPNFFGSSYSVVKGFTDRLMHQLPFVLNVRIRMPIVGDASVRNFITKITSYEKVCSIPNSMTVLPTLLPIMADMMKNKRSGTINLVNPGLISHNDILHMYKSIVDPSFTWKNFTLEEQNKILLSKRSNNQLCNQKLLEWYPDVPTIRDAIKECLHQMKKQSSNNKDRRT